MQDCVKRSVEAGRRWHSSSETMPSVDNTCMASHDLVQVKPEPQEHTYQQSLSFSYDSAHGLPLTPSLSGHSWYNRSVPCATNCYNMAVTAPDYTGLPYYQHQQYTNSPVVDTILMQYPTFVDSDQTNMQALFYDISYSSHQNGSLGYAPNSSRKWPLTPQSHNSTPKIAQRPSPSENSWPSPILSIDTPPSKRETSDENMAMVSRLMDLIPVDRSTSYDTKSFSGSESGPDESYNGSISPACSNTDDRRDSKIKLRSPRESKISLDPQLCCPICDKVFTRRSNCREHFKRHNPVTRQAHACHECGKFFGRKTDLKRHYSTVSSFYGLTVIREGLLLIEI